jgi:4-alpha-glucanotransferase
LTLKHDKALQALARLHGIQLRYRDGTGTARVVPSSALQSLLHAMGVKVGTEDEARQSLKAVRLRRWTAVLDEVFVAWEGEDSSAWQLTLPLAPQGLSQHTVAWQLTDEQGREFRGESSGDSLELLASRSMNGKDYCRLRVLFPEQLPLGYYRLAVRASGLSCKVDEQAFVIVAPRQCYLPDQPRRSWGLTVQLYGFSSGRNWGIGDFTDLSMFATWAGDRLGASTIGLNPLHALSPQSISPYYPSSRLFFNPLYLDIEAIPDFQEAHAVREQVQSLVFQERLKILRKSPTVDYESIRAVKVPILESLFAVFCQHHVTTGSERAQAFDRFVHQQGATLLRFSVFQVLQEQYPQVYWRHWPSEYQDPTSTAIEEFSNRNRERIQYFQYLQWQCVEQLDQLNVAAKKAGLSFGLYQDLAVGIDAGGADAWMFQDQLASGVSIGAPPDTFNLSGQNWGLQPPIPGRLRSQAFQYFRETLSHNMEYGGMLRIDHALGLFRLYWIPEGKSGSEGAYVRFPVDELLAILALESVRHQVMVVAEDLGTVTPTIRGKFSQAGLLSYRLLMFEKVSGQRYRAPNMYPELALASVNTHDLPTLRGFWVGRDIETKEQIGLYPSVSHMDHDRMERTRDRQALLQALDKAKLLPEGTPAQAEDLPYFSDDLCQATYAYLARTPCRVVATSLEDLLGEVDTPNVPGAPEGAYPVWQKKLSRPFEEWQNDQDLLEFAAAIHRERAASSS